MDAFFRFCLRGGDPQNPETRRRCGVLSGGAGIGLNLLLFLGKLLAGRPWPSPPADRKSVV